MENIYVQDHYDLLNGYLLSEWVDKHGCPTRPNDDDATLEDVGSRHVFISGGYTSRAYGGPEEGGWWYDHFTPTVEVEMVVSDADKLREAVSHVESLLRIQHGEDWDTLRIALQPHEPYRPGRPRYE